jgi:hypothetical protein
MTWQVKIVNCGIKNLPPEIRYPQWIIGEGLALARHFSPLTNPQASRKI